MKKLLVLLLGLAIMISMGACAPEEAVSEVPETEPASEEIQKPAVTVPNIDIADIPYKETDNPVFQGKMMKYDSIIPENSEKSVVFRPQDTIFKYAAWPSICSDENGTLYAVSAWGSTHVCPFTKVCMYISKDGGKTWSPPIVVQDSYIGDGHGGINYLGNGKMILSWAYHPGDVMLNELYGRVTGTMWGGTPTSEDNLRAAMLETYWDIPPEKLVGGSFVKISEDYGMTWSEPIRLPVASPHGFTQCADGTLLYLGKEYYASTQGTFDFFESGELERIEAHSWAEYVNNLNASRAGAECSDIPIYAYASTDGGYTWEQRGLCNKPDELAWVDTAEPHVVELNDGTLLGAIRVESEAAFENQMAVYTTRSTDGGVTWSEWECTHINGGPPQLMQHSSGAVLLSVGRRTRIMGEYVLVSWDNGLTWTEEYLIDKSPSSDMGYPCTTELPDGDLVTVYYQPYVDPETGETDSTPSIQSVRWSLNK